MLLPDDVKGRDKRVVKEWVHMKRIFYIGQRQNPPHIESSQPYVHIENFGFFKETNCVLDALHPRATFHPTFERSK